MSIAYHIYRVNDAEFAATYGTRFHRFELGSATHFANAPKPANSRHVDAGDFGEFFPEICAMVDEINAALDLLDKAFALKATLHSDEVQRALNIRVAYAETRNDFLGKRAAISAGM